MEDLRFEQRWLVIDMDTEAELHQWEGVRLLCPHRVPEGIARTPS
jgi:3-(3-hydroxy-phenyl)propionate hydroxylase